MNSFIGTWTDQENSTISVLKTKQTDAIMYVSVTYDTGRGPFDGSIQASSDHVITVNFTDDEGIKTGTLSEDKSRINWSNHTVWTRAESTLAVRFKNTSIQFSDQEVYIGFFAGTPASGQAATPFRVSNRATGATIKSIYNASLTYPAKGNWYSLSELSEGVSIGSFSGRIYVCYGSPWESQYKNYEPAQAVTDPNFFMRYDKMEMTYTGKPTDVADLTSIDYWSIPMTLKTYLSSSSPTPPVQVVSGLLNGATASTLYSKLNALTDPPVSGLSGPKGKDGSAIPALVPGEFKQYPNGPKPLTTFARIIGPSSYPPAYPSPGAIPVIPYDLFNDYLSFLNTKFGAKTSKGAAVPTLGKGVIAKIKGNFAGVGPQVPASGPQSKQSYDLTATIDEELNILLTGKIGSVSSTTTMLYKCNDLKNPSGIYGGNAPYYLNGATTSTAPGNDVYGWIGGDLFSGFNIGALGSSTPVNGTMVGALISQDWFRIPSKLFFSGLQPQNPTNYNRWAATLSECSNAYNFAFTDRFAPVFVSLNPAEIDLLEIELLDTQEIS